jgi:hypothetical protein
MELKDIVSACGLDWTWPPWFAHYMTGEPMTEMCSGRTTLEIMKAIKAITEGETRIVIMAGNSNIALWIRSELHKYLDRLGLFHEFIKIEIYRETIARRDWYHLKDHTLYKVINENNGKIYEDLDQACADLPDLNKRDTEITLSGIGGNTIYQKHDKSHNMEDTIYGPITLHPSSSSKPYK